MPDVRTPYGRTAWSLVHFAAFATFCLGHGHHLSLHRSSCKKRSGCFGSIRYPTVHSFSQERTIGLTQNIPSQNWTTAYLLLKALSWSLFEPRTVQTEPFALHRSVEVYQSIIIFLSSVPLEETHAHTHTHTHTHRERGRTKSQDSLWEWLLSTCTKKRERVRVCERRDETRKGKERKGKERKSV